MWLEETISFKQAFILYIESYPAANFDNKLQKDTKLIHISLKNRSESLIVLCTSYNWKWQNGTWIEKKDQKKQYIKNNSLSSK